MTGSPLTKISWSFIEYDPTSHTITNRLYPPTFAVNQVMEFPLQYYIALRKGIILEWIIDPPNEQNLHRPLSDEKRQQLFEQIPVEDYFPYTLF